MHVDYIWRKNDMNVRLVPQGYVVMVDDEEIGRIISDDVDSVFYEDNSGAIYSSGVLQELLNHIKRIEKEVT